MSTDVEHGAIEVCDEKGKHIDEYTYEGKAQNKKDITGKHDILPLWLWTDALELKVSRGEAFMMREDCWYSNIDKLSIDAHTIYW